jgi:diguanylate cyclase (GGDEF)-like protein/PAS domain S-box-containing protein
MRRWAPRADRRTAGELLCVAALLAAGAAAGAVAARSACRRRMPASDTRWFEMSNDLLVEASLDGWFVRLSEGWEASLGWTREELMARPFREFVHPEDREPTAVHADALDRQPGEVLDFENRYRAKDGSYRWLSWRARSDGERKYAVARDITDRKHLAQEREALLLQLAALARTDPVTALPNRRAWEEELEEALARARRHGYPLALGLIDLDRFKAYNDANGHPAGDALLGEAAACWRRSLRVTDFLARYGGEEFAVLLPDCPIGEVTGMLERLRAATPDGQTVSVGVAAWDGFETPTALVARADAALYVAKESGRDRIVVSRADDWAATG